MQFKVTLYVNKSLGGITVEGNTVQCLRRTDERTATGRRRQRVICTIDRWASELSAEVRELLTEEEQAEWAAWKVKHDAEYRKKQLGIALDAVTKTMEAATTALRECVVNLLTPLQCGPPSRRYLPNWRRLATRNLSGHEAAHGRMMTTTINSSSTGRWALSRLCRISPHRAQRHTASTRACSTTLRHIAGQMKIASYIAI